MGADTMVKRAKGQAEAMVIEADGEAEAWVAEAQGILEAAKKLGNSPLTLELERLRRATEILRSADKLIMTRHVNTAQSKREDPKYVFEINCNRNDPGGAGGPGKASAMTSPSSH